MPESRHVTLNGNNLAYVEAGEGEPVVFIHGITSSARTWMNVFPLLEDRARLIAIDLPGHGRSDKPRTDYSLSGHASAVRDLLLSLGIERATIVGHSLGGGVALQFAYLFPERVGRMVLVGAGGLGRTVGLPLRAATLPGSEIVIPLLAHPMLGRVATVVRGILERTPLHVLPGYDEMARGYFSLSHLPSRRAFVRTLRSVVDFGGSAFDATDRIHLAGAFPTLIVWGGRDKILPVGHGIRAHGLIEDSRLVVFDDASHFPHMDEPQRFADALRSFLDETEPRARRIEDFYRDVIDYDDGPTSMVS